MKSTLRPWLSTVGVCIVLLAFGCGKPAEGGFASSGAESRRSSALGHDLSVDERQGGHTLQRHVGKSDAELRDRLFRERHISAASTYTDRSTAEQAIGAALQENKERITRWAGLSGGHPNLVLDYRSAQPLGRTMHRGNSISQPCADAVVVLRWRPNGYYVLTSYPECR